ncbi:MAG: reverse transcriptase family protein [Solirubrobacteraceae bacterium]
MMSTSMYTRRERTAVAGELAAAMLGVRWTAETVAEAAATRLGHWPSWLDALASRIVASHHETPDEEPAELAAVIEAFLAEHRAGSERVRFDWPVAEIASVDHLAAALELSDGQLAWLADIRGLERTVTAEKLRNYRYAAVPRRSGLPRVIEAPKLKLKEVQRWVLREILDHVPVHDAAQGFARGRSVADHARSHSGQHAVLRLDLADFFASVSAARVFGIFRTAGYEPPVAHVLSGLTTNTVPGHIWQVIHGTATAAGAQPRFRLGRQLAAPHLPQGAPTSPALANLAAFRLDRRLSGLAASLGLRYTRYADDLAFSGPRAAHGAARLRAAVAEIVRDEGFTLNEDKTVLRTAAARQQVCGIVVNVSPNVPRHEYDRLKAILHNAARHGPASQGLAGQEAHLRGRIAWAASLNPARGEKLRRRFAAIDWGSGSGPPVSPA